MTVTIESREVKAAAARLGADICGIAAATSLTDAPHGFHPQDVLPGCRSVVVVARRFLATTLEALSTIPYTVVRNQVSREIDDISTRLSCWLEEQGAAAVPTGAIGPCECDAELVTSELCPPKCTLCIEACPIGALDGPLMKQVECWEYAFGEKDSGDWRISCFRCRAVCPQRFGCAASVHHQRLQHRGGLLALYMEGSPSHC
jgi:epoxyqueuosine reductase